MHAIHLVLSKTSDDLKYRKHNAIKVEYFKASKMRYSKMRYKRTHNIESVVWRKYIAKMKSNNFELCNIFLIACDIINKEIYALFNEGITQSIIHRIALATTDASVKEFQMGGCWIITDEDKSFKTENVLYHMN